MNKKITISLTLLILLAAVLVAGCIETNSADVREYAREKGVANVAVGKTFNFEQKFTENNQERLVDGTPPPRLEKSLERENLKRRYEFLNDENKIFYVYLVSYGKVMAFHTAKGKVSSVNSRLTQEEQVIDVDMLGIDSYEANDAVVVGSPQLDGSYGSNGDGIFFFTTQNAYVEWNGEYLVSDYPLKLSTPPQLVREVN